MTGLVGCSAPGAGSPVEATPPSAPGCAPVEATEWVADEGAASLGVHVEVPRPQRWQSRPEDAARLLAAGRRAEQSEGESARPQSAVVLTGPVQGADAQPPIAVATVSDVTADIDGRSPDDYLDYQFEVVDDLATQGQHVDKQPPTTLCGFPARSHVLLDSPRGRRVFNIMALVPAAGRSYRVDLGVAPFGATDTALRDEIALVLAGVRIRAGVSGTAM
ncbi:hypothetical protein SBI67_03750 [Mycolicibacterium sp. 120266]|uniref:hypothetical protein n=1 Tax=Mycolicibacterium sp. 120266 TaxID=3090601 RepID=UPI00299D24E4|nr:hypothetical protein [Mycolicibacterium sp. 120266]MDX1871225.1 hypothetical protein [Mycolicibacterium sp. 120266]